MNQLRNLVIVCVCALATGCAFTDAKLPVEYDETNATKGPISQLEPMQFSLSSFEDSREDQERIGYKRNGYGAKTADITTEKPVPDIVSDALQSAILHNGHSLSDSGDVQIDGNVTQFWFDVDVNFWTVRFMGTVSCELEFIDPATGNLVYEREYQGYYEKETGGGLERTWTEVMQLALENMIDSIVKDPNLRTALRKEPAQDTGP